MKKFENLGKKLSKAEQKNIKGGFIDPGDGQCGSGCSGSCTIKGGPCDGATGKCGTNPNDGKCYCGGGC